MIFSPFLLLFVIFIHIVRAGPHSTASLTPYLDGSLPDCAQACLTSFILNNYPASVCGESLSFDCLCVKPSSSGLTLGEGALECLVSTCPDLTPTYSVSAYEVCSSVNNAVPNTHSILTATYQSSKTEPVESRITSTRSARTGAQQEPAVSSITRGSTHTPAARSDLQFSPSSSALASQSVHLPSIPQAFATSIGPSPAIKTLASTSSSSVSAIVVAAPITATPSALTGPNPVLTKPQIAGVVVASVGAAFLAFGLCFFLCCLRRRRSRRRHSGSSFGGDKVSESHGSTPDMAAITTLDFVHNDHPREHRAIVPHVLVTPARTDGRRNTDPAHIGLALAPVTRKTGDEESGPSPITPKSYRTNSQLLPEKPSYSLFPSPLRIGPNSGRTSSQTLQAPQSFEDRPRDESPNPDYVPDRSSPAPVSTPRFPSSIDTSQAHLQNNGRERNLSDPFFYSQGSPPQIFPVQGPRLQPRSPYTHPDFGPLWATDTIRRPVPAHQSPSARGLLPALDKTGQPSTSNEYPPPPPPPLEQHYLAAIDRSHSRTNPKRKGSVSNRPVTWISTGSGTDIEDDGLENAPEPIPALLPIKEGRSSPDTLRQRSSAGQVAYPTVPTPIEGSLARRPKRPTISTDGHSSFVASRLGEDKAKEIASRISPDHADVRRSAKWKILVSPGLEGDINHPSSSSSSPQTARGLGQHPAFR